MNPNGRPRRADSLLWLRPQYQHEAAHGGRGDQGECRACGAVTIGDGDTFCVTCWRRVPEADQQMYLMLWRQSDAPALTAFVNTLIARLQ